VDPKNTDGVSLVIAVAFTVCVGFLPNSQKWLADHRRDHIEQCFLGIDTLSDGLGQIVVGAKSLDSSLTGFWSPFG